MAFKFNIDEVDFVDIEHRAAIPDDACNYDIENYNSLREYWEGGNCSCGDYDADVMNSRCECICNCFYCFGKLYLFCSDVQYHCSLQGVV